ncbi:ABC transporter ATP-binding protein [Bradyrhizobium japonicum]
MLMTSKVSGTEVKTGGISLHSLQKRYGGVTAVDDVSLSISPGEFVSLLGASGSGKTTTLMMIAGFEMPDSGRVQLDDKDITRLPPHRRELGVIFQNYALFPHMTVAENVAYPCVCVVWGRRRSKAASAEFSIRSTWVRWPLATRTRCPAVSSRE